MKANLVFILILITLCFITSKKVHQISGSGKLPITDITSALKKSLTRTPDMAKADAEKAAYLAKMTAKVNIGPEA
jgi:hypothetical protein